MNDAAIIAAKHLRNVNRVHRFKARKDGPFRSPNACDTCGMEWWSIVHAKGQKGAPR